MWCWNCILRVQRKCLTSFFRNFRRHFPDFEQPFLRKNARTGFFVISDTFCKKRQKTSILRLLTGFQEQYFGKVDKTTFLLSRGNFRKQNVFCRKLTLWSFQTFHRKNYQLWGKSPTMLTKLLLMSTAKQCGKKNFLKKTVCSRICYRLLAGILRQFSRGCFLHLTEYTSDRKCRPKKGLFFFVFEIWYKNLRTFSETFPQGYLYCILVVQRHLLGKNVAKVFLIISIFWVRAEAFRQVVRITIH